MKYLKNWSLLVKDGVPLLFMHLSTFTDYKSFLALEGPTWNRFIKLVNERDVASIVFMTNDLSYVALAVIPKEKENAEVGADD